MLNLQNELNNFDLPEDDLVVPFECDNDVELLANSKMKSGVILTTAMFNQLAEAMNYSKPAWEIY